MGTKKRKKNKQNKIIILKNEQENFEENNKKQLKQLQEEEIEEQDIEEEEEDEEVEVEVAEFTIKRNLNNRSNHEALIKFIEAGGKKCFELFQYLSSSTHWRKYGTLPPLNDQEAIILNHMYQLWIQNQHDISSDNEYDNEENEENEDGEFSSYIRNDYNQQDNDENENEFHNHNTNNNENNNNNNNDNDNYDDNNDDNDNDNDGSQGIPILTCISTIKETCSNRVQYTDSLLTLLNQLDLLMKSPEPCRTHASDLLEIFMLPEFLERNISSLEKMFIISEAHPGYVSATSIALGLLAESEHLVPSSLVNKQIESNLYYNTIALNFYLKSNLITSHFSIKSLSQKSSLLTQQTSKPSIASSFMKITSQSTTQSNTEINEGNKNSGEEDNTQNSISCMLLGSLYLKTKISNHNNNNNNSSSSEKSNENDDENNNNTIKDTQSSTQDNSENENNYDYQSAFNYYKLAALARNPIAQHKVGYFYDEGLPNNVCNVDIMEAVKWYSLAAELMPDSMHNLAKIYEDGRGGFEPDMTQAVTLYSVAAARGFPLSQVNLGRLFLLGEDGVTRDREAGKRLLTLAAESGDADAQMVVGMIHATPAFECYDLKLSELWLRQSLAGGKQDAERLLLRVRQQLAQQENNDETLPSLSSSSINDNNNNNSNNNDNQDSIVHIPISKNALAAKLRGDDFVCHGLLHAAVLEYSRAFELDRTKLSYFVDRLDALCILGHYEECLTDSSLLLSCVDSNGFEFNPSHQLNKNKNKKGIFSAQKATTATTTEINNLVNSNSSRDNNSSRRKKEVDFFRIGLQSSTSLTNNSENVNEKLKESQESMSRLYDILVESLGFLFSSTNYPLFNPLSYTRLNNNNNSSSGINSINNNNKSSAVTGMSSADTGGLLDSYNSLYDQTISSPGSELWPFSLNSDDNQRQSNHNHFGHYDSQNNENRQQFQQLTEDYMINLHQHHREPIICRLLQDCMDWELKSIKSSAFLARLTSYDRYYTGAVIRSGGIPILLSILSYPSKWKNTNLNLSLAQLTTTITSPITTNSNSNVSKSKSNKNDQQSLDSSTNNNQNNKNNKNNNILNNSTIKKYISHEQLWLNCSIILHNLSFSHMAKKVMYLLSATDGFPIMCNCLRLCRDKVISLSSSNNGRYCSAFFRSIGLARTSTTLIQILLSSACVGKEGIWDELMISDLVGGLSAALECVILASHIESDSIKIFFLQELQHIRNNVSTHKLQHILTVRESCLQEINRILMDTVHTLARILKIAPPFVLSSAASILMIPLQRILVAITNKPSDSESIYDSLKSATAFCLCKLLCARDPRNAELLQQSLSNDGIKDILINQKQSQTQIQNSDNSLNGNSNGNNSSNSNNSKDISNKKGNTNKAPNKSSTPISNSSLAQPSSQSQSTTISTTSSSTTKTTPQNKKNSNNKKKNSR